ncbi:MAG: class I SAM-dependent methyltransferase [Elusimicrobia bacterium]|nr:class I SAM-dependent methyltransferase [Elusimicrobiota bacterium]
MDHLAGCPVCGADSPAAAGAPGCPRCGLAARRDAEGIWTVATAEDIRYPQDGNARMSQLEEKSFWFRHRNQVILAVMRRLPWSGTLIDVGGGNGLQSALLQTLSDAVVLLEPGRQGCLQALRRGVGRVIQGTLPALSLRPGSLGGLACFDVVEHLPDPAPLLAESRRVLAPGGRVYITVPAYGTLWSGEDDEARHCRRYTARSLRETLTAAGFEVEFLTGFFRMLVLPILLFRAAPYRLGLSRRPGAPGREHVPGPLVSWTLGPCLRRELRRISSGESLSWGASWFLVGRVRV